MPRRLDGTVDLCDGAGTSIDVTGNYYDVLLAIDHNPQLEGPHNAQFGLAWYAEDGQTRITFVGPEYETFNGDKGFTMWPYPPNTGLPASYGNSRVRKAIQGFLPTITDATLREAIVPTPKYVDDDLSRPATDPSNVVVYRDAIWIPSLRELLSGDHFRIPRTELALTEPFPQPIQTRAYVYNNPSVPSSWALRSRAGDATGDWFVIVNSGGGNSSYTSGWKLGVCPCYTIA